MSDILVSIIESVADAAAARVRRSAPVPASLVQRFTEDQPTKPAAPPPARKAPPTTTSRAAVSPTEPAPPISLGRLFADPQSLIRTVLASEILGPPIALRRQNPWDTPGV